MRKRDEPVPCGDRIFRDLDGLACIRKHGVLRVQNMCGGRSRDGDAGIGSDPVTPSGYNPIHLLIGGVVIGLSTFVIGWFLVQFI